jgi:hypothetical protein
MMSATPVSASRIVYPKIVQRYSVAGFFQPAASSDHQVVGGNGFENLDYGLFRWQKTDVVLQQDVTSAVDEGSTAIAENVETEQHKGCSSCFAKPRPRRCGGRNLRRHHETEVRSRKPSRPP